MADNKIRLPSSEGGLVSYSGDSTGSKISIKPEYAVVLVIVVAVAVALVNVLL